MRQRYSFERMVASFEELYLAGLRGPAVSGAQRAAGGGYLTCAGLQDDSTSTRRTPVDRGSWSAMTDAVAHRGPDADGYYLDGAIGLGHRRLSIIDLATGDQPIGNEDGSVQVVFNGEIYNFAEVRARADRARPPLPDQLRHRSHRARLRAVG